MYPSIVCMLALSHYLYMNGCMYGCECTHTNFTKTNGIDSIELLNKYLQKPTAKRYQTVKEKREKGVSPSTFKSCVQLKLVL